MNPAPDADVNSVGTENFEWIVDAVAELAVRKAKKAHRRVSEYRWSAFLGGYDRRKKPAGQRESSSVRISRSALASPRRNRKLATRVGKGAAWIMRPSLNIGIEEEYQTIDPETRDLRSHIASEILAQGKRALHEAVKPEMHQAVIEVGTRFAGTSRKRGPRSLELRREMIRLASENGLLLVAASTHPFADWKLQEIYPDERYRRVIEEMQMVGRANLVFGLHVHVGIEDRNTAIHIMNSMRYFLPHILALSSNSPFWRGHADGFKTYRTKVFERFPRTGIPDVFANWAELRNLRQSAGQDRLHRQREEDLVGHPAASLLQHLRSAGLRHPDAAG